MSGDRPYHRFVFDTKRRSFVGEFDAMYRAEDAEGYDSWFQDDLTALGKRVSLALLERRNWASILDVGCGKGAFTNMLKRANNRVVGLDVSQAAIEKARARYRGIDFRVGTADSIETERFELVVAMEVLSYLEDWREALARFRELAPALYLTLYLPPDPIGFVKSFDELRVEIEKHYVIETEIVAGDQVLLLAFRPGAADISPPGRRPHHDYIFDAEARRFVGAFEDLYRAEERESFDSSFQDDLGALGKRLSLAVLERWNWGSVLDVGCGKGAFTNLLRRGNNHVVGVDVSTTAIRRAQARFPWIDFRVADVAGLGDLDDRFELVVAMEILSYLEDWRATLRRFAELAPALFLTLYLPPDPIGFVKAFDDLRAEVERYYTIESAVLHRSPILNGEQLLLLGLPR